MLTILLLLSSSSNLRGEREEKKKNSILKMPKKGWRHGQAIEHLPSKCKALSSNPSTAKKKKKGTKQKCSNWIMHHP
jgi:hypothetical protein